MYRIELAPGEETVFRTFEELATGVRNGFITPRARIYHAASQKWLPIEFHPHYKRALENPASAASTNPADRARGTGAGSASASGLFGSVALTSGTQAGGTAASGTSAGGAAQTGAPATGALASSVPAPNAPAPGPSTTTAPAADTPASGSSASGTPASGMSTGSVMTPGAVAPPASLYAEYAESAPVSFAPVAPSPEVTVSHHLAFDPPAAAPASVTHSPLSLPEGALALLSTAVFETTDDAPAPEASVIYSHGVEALTATEDASVEELVLLQPVAASQALELPKISYPEITPAEAPVAHRPRTLGGSPRMLYLAGVAVVLVAGAYAAVSVFLSRPGDSAPVSAETVADRPAMPAQSPAAPQRAGATARVPITAPAATSQAPVRAPAPTPAPARLNPSQPASSGFAPALEPRALVSAATKPAVAGQPASSSDSSLAPPPVALDLAVPALPQADSLVTVPGQHSDSAIKRILRAVSGGKDIPQQR